ncbi:MORN repeat-containing protein [Polynucleobacter sp. MWH-HuK1]|uniref:MORN repeat-containing protein n=1 Tax=Polynucleobacter sp. MWH-HuK1 TaxID=1743158 RepID=UPI001C0BBCE3|nr:hypothetical protein [Polynucleobacter sp. MWH-HuK1]MBU3565071.1 hypothetical protein [Polynucleobacter sp. MWH-HuK1]
MKKKYVITTKSGGHRLLRSFFMLAVLSLGCLDINAQSKLPACKGEYSDQWNNCFGKYSLGAGDLYVGEFKDGHMHGQGSLTYGPGSWMGDKYVGTFKKNLMNGKGSYFFSNGDRYEGGWLDGKISGTGTYWTASDGSKYVGEWTDHKKNGKGVLYFADGRVLDGIFQDNNYIGPVLGSNNQIMGQSSNKKPIQTSGIDSSLEEATCAELGFKKKTEAYASCVLELLVRKEANVPQNASDPDDATCRKYGFKPKTNEYATCRQQIDQARSQAAQQQAQYLQQQRQYQAQLDEQQRQRSVAAGMALFQMGTGIASGAYNANNSYGTVPTPPNPNRTYILPGGRTMNCSTTGTVTNCF